MSEDWCDYCEGGARIRQANDHAENCERLLREAEVRIEELEAEYDAANVWINKLETKNRAIRAAADRLADAVEQQVAPGSFAGRAVANYRGEDTDE